MSDDQRTDFFASGDAPDTESPPPPSDERTGFFSDDRNVPQGPPSSPEPVYDAALFRKRIGRDPEPAELANFKALKGQGWATGNGGGSLKGLGEAALATGSAALKGINTAANDLLPDMGTRTAVKNEIDQDPIFNYHGGPEAQPYIDALGNLLKPVSYVANKVHQGIASVAGERAADVAGDIAQLLPAARGVNIRGAANKLISSMHDPEAVSQAPSTAEEVLADQAANSKGNMGAAEATPSLEGVSPETKSAIANSQNISSEALRRHIDAETLPMPEGESPLRLRKGQATGEEQQISDEKNMRADPDTQGLLSSSITEQDAKLGTSMGEIRRRATPEIVGRSNIDHGQSAIDSIKTQDNAAVTDMRQKYKTLADANGGSMPVDTNAALTDINGGLRKGFLTKTASQDPVVSEVLDKLNSGTPMSFEEFENARTNLAAVQRKGGSAAAAAGIVRNALEKIPLSPGAAKLKSLADEARSAAKARFDTIEQNPAYEAAVNDNVPMDSKGLHVIGAPSPLADSFMDRYFLGNGSNASRAYISRVKGIMQNDPDFVQAIEASSLNKLRDAAGLDVYNNGSFRNASYRNARKAMDPKADVLMSPTSADSTDQLMRVSGYVNDEGKASTVNRSNTALTLQRFGAQYPQTPGLIGTLADYGGDIAAAHVGPVGYAAKKIGQTLYKSAKDKRAVESMKSAKLKFAQDATAPGAGIDSGEAPRTARASGGKVDHEALVNRLIQRWKSAKKDTDRTTEPLLKVPDAAIVRALDIAQEHL